MSRLDPSVTEKLRRYVRTLAKNDELAAFIECINSSGEAFIFGGAPRDVSFANRRLVHDLDIFVSGVIDIERLSRVSTIVRRTNFGGLRLMVGRHEVDIWELDKSHAFRLDSRSYVSIQNLLRTVCFSTDAVAVSLKSGKSLSTDAFERSLKSRRLDFVVQPKDREAVVGARIARLALKLNLRLTPWVANYFVGCVDELGIAAIIDAESRWAGGRLLNDLTIEHVMTDIRTSIDEAYSQISTGAGSR